MKRSILIVFVIQCFCLSQLWGQDRTQNSNQQSLKHISESDSQPKSKKTRTIQGKIIDKAGESIVGANVYIPGTTIGTTSNLDGVFQLEIPAGTKSLKISYMGYTTMEITPENNMKITLRPDATQINEVNIVAKQTTIQVTAAKTTVYPALSPITSSGTAYSVLKK